MNKKVTYSPKGKVYQLDKDGEEEALRIEFERMKKEHKAKAQKKEAEKKGQKK